MKPANNQRPTPMKTYKYVLNNETEKGDYYRKFDFGFFALIMII